MFVGINSQSIRLTGRWHIKNEKAAITTAPGGVIECAFTGETAVLHFDTDLNCHPFPHLWVSVDNGTKVEVPLDRYLRLEPESSGTHYVKIIFKGAVEMQHRWHEPLIGQVAFLGFEAEGAGELPEDNRSIIEFIGDSITEGVLIDAKYDPGELDQPNRVYQDDATATYAWLTAEMLGVKPVIMGYGGAGMTVVGQGAVPPAGQAYPYCYAGVPFSDAGADLIVINLGVNDFAPEAEFEKAYLEFLELVRSRNKTAKIIALTPFWGRHEEAIAQAVEKFNLAAGDAVLLVSTAGWIPKEPLHPLRDGHKAIAKRLCEVLCNLL